MAKISASQIATEMEAVAAGPLSSPISFVPLNGGYNAFWSGEPLARGCRVRVVPSNLEDAL